MKNPQPITLGSLFDGIGGFPYAASFYGIKPLWASEIIPAAISITRRHFPDMEHIGDITKLSGGDIPPVDIITFGSPCQSFSIAGGRKGLEGKSGLFWEAIRIIREMRKTTNGEYPRYSIFENVPGILSANRGRDYKTVLEAFTETEIPFPPSGRWTNAGMVRGGGIDCAWVIHDAQYFGVAQRRRRLFAVCDFTGQRAAEILFKPKSLHWYFASGGEAGKETAANASERSGSTGGTVTVMNDQGGNSLSVEKKSISPTLRSETHGNLPIVSMPMNCHPDIAGIESEYELCEAAKAPVNPVACGFDLQQITSKTNRSSLKEVQPVLCQSGRPHVVINTNAENDNASNETTAYCLQGNMIGRKDENGPQGDGVNDDVCFTLSATDRHAVAAVFSRQRSDSFKAENLASTQTARQSKDATDLICHNSVRTGYIVRRLTPTECEFLQGYFDGYTEHGHDGKPLSDTARYQALGNSVAIPCVAYVIAGIVDELTGAADSHGTEKTRC